MVTLTDGTQVTAKEYVAQQTADQQVEMAADRARLEERERWLPDPPTQNQETETETEEELVPVKFDIPEIETDTFESDTERTMYNTMKSMGEQTTTIVNELRAENKELRERQVDTDRLTRDVKMDSEFARVEAKHGTTREKIMEVHRENPNSFDIDLLAEVAVAREKASESTAETAEKAREQRKEDLAKVGGASNERGAARDSETTQPGRGVDWRSGASIAEKYTGLLPV